MASRKDTIMKAATRTAQQAHAAASKRISPPRGRVNSNSHRHCVVCWKPIPLESDPSICEGEDCERMHSRREKSRRRWTFLMYLGRAIFVGLLVFQLIAY